MNFKTVSFLSLLTCITLLQTEEPSYKLAETPYSKKDAALDFADAGYDVDGKELVTRGNSKTGASFVDVVLSAQHDPWTGKPYTDTQTGELVEIRAVCYGPGRYVLPHSHNEHELFHVTLGSCKFWTLEYDEQGVPYWIAATAQEGDTIQIPAHVIHCLLASPRGLCMHVPWNDRTRSVDFVPTVKAPFEKD